MKTKLFLLAILLIICRISNGQVLTTNPELPVPDQAVTITFDAALCDCDLSTFTGDIYAHTGVNLESGATWQHVVGSWGNNTTQPKLTSLGNHKYSLEISPSIDEFYGIGTSETISQLCFVFRSADGTKQSSDLFVDIFSDPYAILFSSPDTNSVYSFNDITNIEVAALFANNLALFINDTEITNVAANSLSYEYTINNYGFNEIKISASDGETTIVDSINIFVRNENTVLNLPYADLHDGINYIDENTVTLLLYAPFKDFVFVKGSFNEWTFQDEYQMNVTPNDSTYWITLSGLTANEEYTYQYVIDGNLYIADPYADKILDPWNDSYIGSLTYPGLIPYPTGKASGIVSVFQTNQAEFEWNTTDFVRPANEELVIYELLVRDFVAAHNYSTLIDTLDYLKNLGVNAIELMPFNEFEGNSSWGYNPSFYFAPDKYYGTKNDLKIFIDLCHENGIAVIMDMVLNHSYGQCPLVQMYFDPNAGDYGQPSDENPWFNEVAPNPVYSWGSDFNHQSKDTKKFVSRVVKYWLEEYKIDGYRFDFTKGFTNTTGDGWAYDAPRIQILKNIADTIWTTSPGAYVILEHLTDNSEEKVLANYGIMLWGNLNNAYCEASMGYADGDSDFSWISYKNRGWNSPHVVGYQESHDEERQMFKNITYGNSSEGYNIKDLPIALKRAELTSVFFFTIPGPKMIWQFEELGYDISIEDPCRVCEKPVKWDYFDNENRYRLYDFYKVMINLKKTYDVFNSEVFSIYSTSKVKQIILQDTEMDVVIIGNFDVTNQDAEPEFTKAGSWFDYFTGTEITNTDTVFNLKPGEYHIFTTTQLPMPEIVAFPEALSVSVLGETKVDAVLTGKYTFFDLNGDTEENSLYQWYRADDASGTNKDTIDDANDKLYILTTDDIEKYISFEVTPVSNSNFFKQGIPVSSKFAGPVTATGADIFIYPNPSGYEFNLTGISEYTEITVRDLMGKVIRKYSNDGNYSIKINLCDVEQGMYIVKFSNADTYISKRIMKLNL